MCGIERGLPATEAHATIRLVYRDQLPELIVDARAGNGEAAHTLGLLTYLLNGLDDVRRRSGGCTASAAASRSAIFLWLRSLPQTALRRAVGSVVSSATAAMGRKPRSMAALLRC